MKVYSQFLPRVTINGQPGFTLPTQPMVSLPPADAGVYEETVARVLDKIKTRDTGKAIFAEMIFATGELGIAPMRYGLADARCLPRNQQDTAAQGEVLRHAGDDPQTAAVEAEGDPILDRHGKPLLGTGKGSDVLILYHPNTWRFQGAPFDRIGNVDGHLEDDVLVHELVHALRLMKGSRVYRGMGNAAMDARYAGNLEEFYALMVTNIYRSEADPKWKLRGKIGAVGATHSYATLEGRSADPDTWYQEHRTYIAMFCQDRAMSGLAMALRYVEAQFNPVAQYLKRHQPTYAEVAQQLLAKN